MEARKQDSCFANDTELSMSRNVLHSATTYFSGNVDSVVSLSIIIDMNKQLKSLLKVSSIKNLIIRRVHELSSTNWQPQKQDPCLCRRCWVFKVTQCSTKTHIFLASRKRRQLLCLQRHDNQLRVLQKLTDVKKSQPKMSTEALLTSLEVTTAGPLFAQTTLSYQCPVRFYIMTQHAF